MDASIKLCLLQSKENVMRYSKEHKENTRKTVLEEGGKLIKQYGLGAASVDQIMSAAGLSGAAMYSHFGSKAGLMEALLHLELERSKQLFALAVKDSPRSKSQSQTLNGEKWCKEVLTLYFHLPFVRDTKNGCVLPSLSQETSLQQIYAQVVSEITEIIGHKTGRPELADGILAAAMGAVSMARAVPNDVKAQAILDSVSVMIEAALASDAVAPHAFQGAI
jgi:TetR/AcrR family transcriptional regulator, transcriptional repressor for nem operon